MSPSILPGESGTGHYLRSFAPAFLSALSVTTTGASTRGNNYPPSLWATPAAKAFTANGQGPNSFIPPSFSCANAGGEKPATPTGKDPLACWVAPTLPTLKPGQFPHVNKASYSTK